MREIDNIFFKIVPILYMVALWTIFATAHISGYALLLKQMSCENGFFEILGTIALFIGSIYGIYSSFLLKSHTKRVTVVIFSILMLLAGMEEISWTQQLFHFPSSEYFMKHNLQAETNLHNLIDANLFSSTIYSLVYALLVFTPLLYKIFPYFKRFKILRYFDINPHIILITLFGSSFQLYFYQDMGVFIDMVTLFFAIILFAYYLTLYRANIWLKIHFITILLSVVISISSYHIYSFFNMQYEIRESFIELAGVLIFMELIKKERLSIF